MTIAAKTVQKLQLIRKKGYGLAPVSPTCTFFVCRSRISIRQLTNHICNAQIPNFHRLAVTWVNRLDFFAKITKI